jgi:NADP-dependent aldehyde dehydrogenase
MRGEAFEGVGAKVAEHLDAAEPGIMLYDGLANAYVAGVERATANGARTLTHHDDARGLAGRSRGRPTVLAVDVDRFADDAALREEVFGPASIVVTADDAAGLERAAEALEGQLTATVFGTVEDLQAHANLLAILERKVGRIVFNGVPTGVEVGHAMHHGGPYPASSDARTTSVGSAAILRFARPVCYQDFPDAALPPALRNRNELGIWRLVDGRPTRDDL